MYLLLVSYFNLFVNTASVNGDCNKTLTIDFSHLKRSTLISKTNEWLRCVNQIFKTYSLKIIILISRRIIVVYLTILLNYLELMKLVIHLVTDQCRK